MREIQRYNTLDNIGGIVKLWYLPVEFIQSMTRPIHAYGGITLIAGKSWFPFYFSPQSGFYKHKFTSTDKGSYYKCTIEGIFPHKDPDNDYDFLQNNNLGFVCKVLDANGYYHIVGTRDFPLRFTYDFKTGSSPGDRNSVSFSFSGDQLRAPFFLTSQDGSQT